MSPSHNVAFSEMFCLPQWTSSNATQFKGDGISILPEKCLNPVGIFQDQTYFSSETNVHIKPLVVRLLPNELE